MDQRQLLLAARLVAEHLRLPLRAAAGGEGAGRDSLDQMILLQAVGDEVADGPDLEAVRAREIHQVVEAGHGPVLAHDLADHSARVEAREPRDVDGGLGVAGANEHAAGPGDERKDVAGRDDGVGPVGRIDRHGDGPRAVGGADARSKSPPSPRSRR